VRAHGRPDTAACGTSRARHGVAELRPAPSRRSCAPHRRGEAAPGTVAAEPRPAPSRRRRARHRRGEAAPGTVRRCRARHRCGAAPPAL